MSIREKNLGLQQYQNFTDNNETEGLEWNLFMVTMG